MFFFHVFLFHLFLLLLFSFKKCYLFLYVFFLCREGRRKPHISWNWNSFWLWATTWVLGIEPKSLSEQQVFLTTGLSFHVSHIMGEKTSKLNWRC